ncbi:MAG: hypothetical protein ABIB46_02190 [bacterium]
MLKNKIIILVLICLFISIPIKAQFVGMFADIGYGARPVGMGGAFVAVSDDVNALVWNNAGLAYAPKEIIFMCTAQFNIVPYTFMACSVPCANKKNMGMGFGMITSGDSLLRESTLLIGCGLEMNDFLSKLFMKKISTNFLISNGFTFKLRFISVGQNLEKHVDKSTGSGLGFGTDWGFLIKFNEKFNMGLNLKDLFSPIFCNSNMQGSYTEFILPTNSIGLKYMFKKNVLVSIELDNFRWVKLGNELNFNKYFVLRSGFILLPQGKSFRQIYSIGGGIKFPLKSEKNMYSQLDVSYNIDGVLPNTSKFSLNLIF